MHFHYQNAHFAFNENRKIYVKCVLFFSLFILFYQNDFIQCTCMNVKYIFNFSVKREDVRIIMRVLDRQGTRFRKANRLVRRQCRCPGPNLVWHADGFDKLKPYGFCIYGAIDGLSRYIIC